MSDARPNPRIRQYDAPSAAPDGFLRRVLCIPVDDDYRIVAAVNDVLAYLTLPGVFNPSDEISDIDMQALMSEMILGYFGELETMIGAVIALLTDVLPNNMLWLDGSSYTRVAYPDLYSRIPAVYRIDADNFELPDLNGRFLYGGDGSNLGDTGGESEHTLTVDEIPAHSHTFSPAVTMNVDLESPGVPDILGGGINPLGGVTDNTGGGEPHNNMPPYFMIRFAIVAKLRDCC